MSSTVIEHHSGTLTASQIEQCACAFLHLLQSHHTRAVPHLVLTQAPARMVPSLACNGPSLACVDTCPPVKYVCCRRWLASVLVFCEACDHMHLSDLMRTATHTTASPVHALTYARRYSEDCVSTHDRVEMAATSSAKLADVTARVESYDVIGVDEGQFFPDVVTFCEAQAVRCPCVTLDYPWLPLTAPGCLLCQHV
jgi:hypothetical protein